jgi:hypothetical protein
VPQGAREPIAAIARRSCATGLRDRDDATAQGRRWLRGRFPRTTTLLEEAAENVLADRLRPT